MLNPYDFAGMMLFIDGSDQLIVSIALLQRSLAVAFPCHSIRPADDAGDWAERRRAIAV